MRGGRPKGGVYSFQRQILWGFKGTKVSGAYFLYDVTLTLNVGLLFPWFKELLALVIWAGCLSCFASIRRVKCRAHGKVFLGTVLQWEPRVWGQVSVITQLCPAATWANDSLCGPVSGCVKGGPNHRVLVKVGWNGIPKVPGLKQELNRWWHGHSPFLVKANARRQR